MSSFLCFVCHSTVNADTNEDTREKYREVIGMNLCPDSHLCFICCHFLNKMCLFKSICLKRSLEYPVLFSEKGTINLQKSDTQVAILCPEDICIQHLNSQYHYGNTNDNSQSDSEDKYLQLHREQQNNKMEHYNNDYVTNDNLFNDRLTLNEDKNAECAQCVSFGECSHKFAENSHKFSDNNFIYGADCHLFGENNRKFSEGSHRYGEKSCKFNEDINRFGENTYKLNENTTGHNFIEHSHKYGENFQTFSVNNHGYEQNSHKLSEDNHRYDENRYKFSEPTTSNGFGDNSHKYVENSQKISENVHNVDENSHKYVYNGHNVVETSHIDASSQTYDITTQIVVRENELFCKIPKIEHNTENQDQNNKINQEEITNNLTQTKHEDFYDKDSQNSHNSENSLKNNDHYTDNDSSHDYESILNTEIDCEMENTEELNTDNSEITETEKVNRKVKKKEFKKIVLSTEEQKRELQVNRQSKKYLEAVFKCNSCAMGFLLKDSYQTHMMRHEESNGEHRCNICKLRFANPAVLRSHLANHSERYRCRHCHTLVRARQRETHLVACRGRETEGVTCHLCGNVFQGASHYQQHLKRYHQSKTSSRTLSCNVCGKTYNNQAALRTHMITHINRKFTCETCHTIYSSPYTLNQHKKTHSSETSELVHCVTCKTSYKTRKSLLAHWRTALAHKETIYKCSTCDRTCPSLSSLHAHISSVHDRTKHLSCDVCPARYSTRKALVRHMLTHKMQGPKQTPLCHACGEHFKSASKLKRHLKTVCEKDKLEEEICNFYG